MTSRFVTETGHTLGSWVRKQGKNSGILSKEKKQKLQSLGFIWDVHSEKWEKGFLKLREFKDENGNCSVTLSHITADGYKLGSWVGVQRSNKAKLSKERTKRLNEIGFIWSGA